MKKIYFTLLLMFAALALYSQTGIGTKTVDASALLELKSASKGLLPTRVTLQSATDVVTIPGPANGLVVYHNGIAGLPAGLYVNVGTSTAASWVVSGSLAANTWNISGNAFTVAGTNFIGTSDNTDFVIKTNNIERMRLSAATGFVGIGTSAPQTPLDILTPTDGYGMQHSIGSIIFRTYVGSMPSNGNVPAGMVGTFSNHPLDFMVFDNFGARVQTDGRLQFLGANYRKITLFETADNIYQFTGFGINAAGSESLMSYNVSASTGAHIFYAGSSATTSNELMRITGTGQVAIGTATPQAGTLLTVNGDATKNTASTAWAVFSDRRIKKDIRPFTDGLAQVMQIKPVFFKYTGEGGIKASTTDEVGIIAQEMQEIAPYTVVETEKKIDDSGKGLLKFQKADAIVYMLINGMKEQQTQLNEQNARLDQVEQDMKTLKLQVSKKVSRKSSIGIRPALASK